MFLSCDFLIYPPYLTQFSNFGNSVEILFALINGDSIWLVFRAFDSRDFAIYIYSRFFVYSFIFLFIYAVLNLFTSLVKSSYDNSLVNLFIFNYFTQFIPLSIYLSIISPLTELRLMKFVDLYFQDHSHKMEWL